MPPIRSVAILLHHNHHGAESVNYRIWAIAENWRRRGIKVDVVRGVSRPITADLLFPHIDLSVIPDDYWRLIQNHPNVVNRRVRDIRKAGYSSLRVSRDDVWDGPVIVKTNLNSRGVTEALLQGNAASRAPHRRLMRRLAREPMLERARLRWARRLDRYHVFPSARSVPRAVYGNQNLIVERFMPEPHEGGYLLRMHICFAERSLELGLHAPDRMVKARDAVRIPLPPPPPEVTAVRQRLGLDYGKIDYVVHEDRAYVLDVNVTPVLSAAVDESYVRQSADIACGLEWFEHQPR